MKKILVILLASLCSVTAAEPQKATFAAGCFWCVEAIYEAIPGVLGAVSGFSGGRTEAPSYEEVCTETTGHTEAVDVTFDPDRVSYERLLRVFWKSHDPTNGRGVAPDFGDSYRPVLFYRNEEQKAAIEKVRSEVQKDLRKPIATQVLPFVKFWPASDYHQDFVRKNPGHPYVKNVSLPRLRETLEAIK